MPEKLFTTPPDVPEETQCRTLKIPSSKEWLGIFNAALLSLESPYNWERVNDTDLSVDETIELIRPMIEEYWQTEVCCEPDACLLPTGERVLRLDENGYIQQLANGGWIPPTGDYEVPPVPERHELTPNERRCLAAANAANVLEQVYEIAADMIAEGADAAEIIAEMAAYFLAAVGLWLGLAIAALVALALAAFRAFLELAEFMGEDVWDAEFTELLRCLLYGCSTDTDGVVTFDLECITESYAATVDVFDPTGLRQLQLYGQVIFILNVIGIDGLNASGATTEVEEADCSDCGNWCHVFDFTLNNGEWTPVIFGDAAGWSSAGWGESGAVGRRHICYIGKNFDAAIVNNVVMEIDALPSGYSEFILTASGTTLVDVTQSPATTLTLEWTGAEFVDGIQCYIQASSSGEVLAQHIVKVTLRGEGVNPFTVDNCEE